MVAPVSAHGPQADRQIVLADLPRPFVTPESMVAPHRPAPTDATQEPRPRPMQRDPLIYLASEGIIAHRQVMAGQEILRVYTALTASVAPRVSAAYGERLGRSPEPDMPERLRLACANRYGPWREWAGRIAATPRKSLADLTLLVCVDGLGPRQVAGLLSMDQRTVKRRLQVSLHRYCVIAGWVDARHA